MRTARSGVRRFVDRSNQCAALVRRLFALAIAAVVMCTTAAARAQDFAELAVVFNPLTTRSLESAKVELGLDRDQAQMARDLYEGYRTAVRTQVKELESKSKALMEKVRESGDWESMRKGQMAIMREAFEKVTALETSFNDDLKAVLTTEQAEKFPAFERARRRENTRMVQIVAGEAADVIDILRTLKIDAGSNPDLTTVVSEYEVSFDRVLVERMSLLKEFVTKLTSADSNDQDMGGLVKSYLPRIYEKAMSGRDLNRRTARQIVELLPAGDKERFQAEINRRSYPKIYRTTATAKKIEAAKKIEDLSDNQKSSLDAIVVGYAKDVEAANKSWAEAVDAVQEEFKGNISTRMFNDEESAVTKRAEEAFAKRKDVEKRYVDRLESLLNKEQMDRLPATRPDDEIEEVNMTEPDFDQDAIKDWKDESE